MALQLITGSAGSGKSTYLYEYICQEAAAHPERQYFILVPDQFTLETQKTMVEKSQGKGILNIDVLSFHRLAYRVLEQLPARQRTILEDMGKTMLLRKVFSEQKERLTYFKRGIDKPGFLDECKSFLCEMEQYGVGNEENLEKLQKLGAKFEDIQIIYEAFREKMGDTYQMAEELIPQLTDMVHEMEQIHHSVICFDGFTGFTPTQYDLIRRLLTLCDEMYITVTTDQTGKRANIFQISEETVRQLVKIATEIPVECKPFIVTGRGKQKEPYRFVSAGEMAFLEKNLFCYPSGTWEEPTKDISLFVGKKPVDEAKFLAQKIWWMVAKEGYQYDEIAVLTGDINSYERTISREFQKMNIRYFVDAKKNIGANWIADYIQAILELIAKNMDYDATIRFMRNGLSPFVREETDAFENYILATGKRGIRAYEKEWTRELGMISLEDVNELRQRLLNCVMNIWQVFVGKDNTVVDYIRGLYDFLNEQEVFEKMLEQSQRFEEMGEDILAREYKYVYRVVMQLFDEMVDLMGEEKMSADEFRQILFSGMTEGLVGFIPPKKNQVVIGDLTRTRLKDIRVLFFVGFSDDIVPSGQQAPGIISVRERRKIEDMGIELAPNGSKKAANDLYYIYLNLTKPSEKLYLSYSVQNHDGDSRQKSYVLGRIEKMFPRLQKETINTGNAKECLGTSKGLEYMVTGLGNEEYRKENRTAWWELWKYYKSQDKMGWLNHLLDTNKQRLQDAKLSKKAVEKLYEDGLHGSITRLEQFAKCPFAYFALYGLELRSREEYQVSAPDFGNVVHQTMQEMSDLLREKGMRWQDLEEGTIPQYVDDCLDRILSGYRDVVYQQSQRVAFMVTRMKRMLYRTVWAMTEQLKRGAFAQEYSEKSFSYYDDLPSMKIQLDDGKKMLFSGIIDRIDTYDAGEDVYVKVVDYKTGGIQVELNSIFYGLQMQLVLYMAAAIDLEQKHHPDKNIIPAGTLYYYVKDPVISIMDEIGDDALQGEMLKCYRLEGYVNEKAEVLQSFDSVFGVNGYLESGVESPCIPVKVKKDGSFSNYSKVLSQHQWNSLIRHSLEKATEFGNEIMQGNIAIRPYVQGTQTGCDYCEMQSICGMDKDEMKINCRYLEKLEEEEILKKIGEEEA